MKHKNFKSLLSILLVLCMVLTLLPVNDVTVKAAGNVSETITIPEAGYKEFASGTAGNADVATGAADGWYWDGNGNFYLRNCDLKLTGGTEAAGQTKALLYFPMDTTLHLAGANNIVLDNIKMCSYGTVLGKVASVSINFKGTNKKTDSLTFRKTESCSLFDRYKKPIEDQGDIYFYQSDYNVSHIIQNCSLIVHEEGTGFRSYMDNITIENADIDLYDKPTYYSEPESIYNCSLIGSTTISWKGNSNRYLLIGALDETWNKYIVQNAHMNGDSETVYSGKTIEELLVGLAFPRLDMQPVDENQPIIIKPGAPTEYALTCTAGSGIDKDSFSVSYKHTDIDAGAVKTPELTDGSYSIPEAAAVTVKMNLQAEAAFQNCTGLPSDAKVTKGENGEITVTFTMPSEAISLTAYGYKGTPASGTAVVKKSTLLAPCAATVTLTDNTAVRTVTLVRDGEEPLLLTGTDVTTYTASLPQDGCTYKVYVDGADTGKTITLNSTAASASVTYKTYTVTAIKDDVVYANPGVIQLMAGDTLVGNGANLLSGEYDIYLDGEKIGKTNATGDNVLAFYTVTFWNGAASSEAYPADSYFQPQVVLSGKTAVEPEVTPEAPEGMEDMFFAGWEKDSTAFDFTTAITAATTLTAKWISEEEKTEDPAIEAKWTINGESSYGLLSDALAATKTAGRGQILLLKDSVALKAESENELAANVSLTVPEGKAITAAQSLNAKGTINNKGTISCPVANSGTIINSGNLEEVTNESGAKITNTGTIKQAENAGSITGGVITTAENTGTIKGAKVGITTSTGTLDGCTITSGTGINGTVKGYTYAADAVTFAATADTQGTINIGGDTTYSALKSVADGKKSLKVNIITRSTLTESGTLDLDGHSIKGADGKSEAKDGVTPLTANADLTVTGTGSITGGIGYSDEVAGNGGHGIAGNGHNIVIDSNVTVTGGIGGAGISGAAKGGQGGCGVHMGTHDSESTTGTATIAGTVIGGRGGAAVENGTCGKGGYGVCGTDIVDNGGEYQPGKGGDGRTSDPTDKNLTPPKNGEEGKGTENPVKYGITYDLDNIVIDGEQPDVVLDGSDLTLILKAAAVAANNPYLVLPSNIEVTMGGSALTPEQYTYDQETHTLTIERVSGAVTITAAMQKVEEIEVNNATELRNALEAGISEIIVTKDIVWEERDEEGNLLPLEIPEGITVSVSEGKVIDLAECPYMKQGTVTGAGKIVRTLKGKLVDPNNQPVSDAAVKLMLGTTQVNTTQTEADGTYSFGNLDQGIYKLVFEKKDDTTEIQAEDMMILPIETEKPVNPLTTKLLAENYRAVVEIKSGVPVSEVAVGGLNEQFASENLVTDSQMGITSEDVAGGNTVELKLTVDKVPAANAEQVNKIKQKMEEIGDSGKKLIPIDISVTKTVTPEGSAPTSTKLVATRQLIIVVIPLKGELEGKSDYVLYRYHKEGETGSVEKIQKTTNSDGEYIEVFGEHMIAHLKKFSTYGIGYTPLPSESEGGSPSGGGTSSAIFVQKIELSSSANTLTKKGETIQINATITPYYATDKKLTWSSSDNSVATVDENGKVTAVSDGTVTITAKSRNGVTAEVTIVVKLEKEPDTDDSKEDNGKEDNKEENKNDDKENVTDKDKTDTTDITPDNTFRKLRLRSSKVTRNSSTLVWNKVKEADGYVLYGAQCNANGKVYKIKKLATIKDNSTITYKAKSLKSGTYYKYCVAAYKLVNKKQTIIAKSKVIHVATSSGKYGNYKAVKVNKAKIELKAGKTYTIKATQVQGEKPVKKHADIRFETSNSKIAAITKNGVITAKRKGTCTIYVYAQNGIYKTVKVTVK